MLIHKSSSIEHCRELTFRRLQFLHFSQVKRVSGSPIVSGDHKAGNGVVHVIDTLLLTGTKSLYDTVKAYSELKTFEKHLCRSCLEKYISDNGQVTVFAPTNTAFSALPEDVRDNLLLDHSDLKNFLLQHMHKGVLLTTDLQSGLEYAVRPLKGKVIRLKKNNSAKVTLNGDSQLLVENIKTSDGVLHIINKVILV